MIAVVADSASNLPPELAAEHGISIVPMIVHLGDRQFRDGIDLSQGELYRRLANGEGPARTATPSPADFLAAFRDAAPAEVVCVTVAASMSGAHQQAVAAAAEFDGSIEIVDSRSASMAEGFVALAAARAAVRGSSLREAAAAARAAALQTRLFATVDTFEHLQRSGRVNRLQAYAATALDIKPVFAFRDGEPSAVARPRTRRRALDRVVAETVAAAAGGPVRLAAIHAAAEDDARDVAERVQAEVEVAELFVVEVTPVVGVHVGPGLVGTALQRIPGLGWALMVSHLLWLAGAYLAGTLPSTLVAARIRGGPGARSLVAEARREAGETDPHVLMTRHLGAPWAVGAMTVDVVKGFLYLLAARGFGDLNAAWLALCGVAVVLGHAFPFYAARMAGRGMAAASGVYLALLPWQMVVAGVLIVIGIVVKNSGLATTIGMASVPLTAAWQGQPAEFVAMAVVIFGLLLVRRLEGVGEVIRSGVPASRAVMYRCLFDASAVPRPDEVPGRGEFRPPSGS